MKNSKYLNLLVSLLNNFFFLQKVKASLSENYMTNARGSRTSRKPMNIDIDVALPLVCLSVTLEAQDENFVKMTNCSIVMITPFSMSSLFSSSPMFPLLTLTVRLGNGKMFQWLCCGIYLSNTFCASCECEIYKHMIVLFLGLIYGNEMPMPIFPSV